LIRALARNQYQYLIVVGATEYGTHSVMRFAGCNGYQRILRPVVCATRDEATRAAERLVRERRRRGFVEVAEAVEEEKELSVAQSGAFLLREIGD
jgi:predicted DNA-binding WGR domain protein